MRSGDPDGLLAAAQDPFEGHLDGHLEVLTRRPAGLPAEEAVEQAAAEIEAEAAEQVLEVDAPEQVLGGEPGDAGKTPGIVLPPLLLVREDRVGLGDLLEPLLGARLLVPVRVVLERELPERVLDDRLVGVARDAEDLVVIALCRRNGRSPAHA